MNADLELRERLERAAAQVPVDVERRLAQIRRAEPRRQGARRAPRYALAGLFVVLVAATVLQIRSPGRNVFQGAAEPSGRILFGRTTDPKDASDGPGLYVLDVASGGSTTLTKGAGSPTAAQWSPDGNSVAYIMEEDSGSRYAIYVSRSDGSNPVKILEHPKAEGALGPDLISIAWSPDGTRIAFSGRSPGRGRTVTILNADGTGGRVLDGLWTAVSWSPDGGELLLNGYPFETEQSVTPQQLDLYSMRPDGSGLRRLTTDPSVERGASWSPDGKQIVFSRDGTGDYDSDIYVMNADGSGERRITTWAQLDLFPVWSPDGKWIAFSSDRDASPERQAANKAGGQTFAELSMYAMRPDGSDVRPLLLGGDLAVYPLSWAR